MREHASERTSSSVQRTLRAGSGLLALALIAVVGATGCRTYGQGAGITASWTQEQASQLTQASQKLGVPVRTEAMVQFAEFGSALYAAPAANLETIPAARYADGVDLGVAYIDTPGEAPQAGFAGTSALKGFYKVRAFASNPQAGGKTEGRVQLINTDGRAVSELPATVEIPAATSEPAKSDRAMVLLSGQPTEAALTANGGRQILVGEYWLSPYARISFFHPIIIYAAATQRLATSASLQ